MSAEQLPPIIRRGLYALAFTGLTAAGYFIVKEITRDPIKHPDNNKFLGNSTTSKSRFGFRARLSNGEEIAPGADLSITSSTIVSGEDILKALFGGFRGGSGLHLKGKEKFLGVLYGDAKLAVQDSDSTFINYKVPPLQPPMSFYIFHDSNNFSAVVRVLQYSHPAIELEITRRVLPRQEPDFRFAPVRP